MCRRNRHISGNELAMALNTADQYMELACEAMNADDIAWDVFMF